MNADLNVHVLFTAAPRTCGLPSSPLQAAMQFSISGPENLSVYCGYVSEDLMSEKDQIIL